jgi:hypothetical protein
MHTRFKQFSENLRLTHDPQKYDEYLCIFPSKIGTIYALKWKLGILVSLLNRTVRIWHTQKNCLELIKTHDTHQNNKAADKLTNTN